MTGALAAFFFCLAAGAALGCLFLLFQAARILLCAGKPATAALDLLYCCVCAVAVFLCALAVDRGRLRLLQVLAQLLGGWAAVTALGPFTAGLAEAVRKIFCKVSGFFRGICSFFFGTFPGVERKNQEKPGKNKEKAGKSEKKDLKNLCIPVYNTL